MRKWAGLILVFMASAVFSQSAPPMLATVPASRLAHIRRGLNLSEWFAQVWDSRGYTKEHFETWNTTTDIALMK